MLNCVFHYFFLCFSALFSFVTKCLLMTWVLHFVGDITECISHALHHGVNGMNLNGVLLPLKLYNYLRESITY